MIDGRMCAGGVCLCVYNYVFMYSMCGCLSGWVLVQLHFRHYCVC